MKRKSTLLAAMACISTIPEQSLNGTRYPSRTICSWEQDTADIISCALTVRRNTIKKGCLCGKTAMAAI